MSQTRVTCIISSLGGGGAERSILILSEKLSELGFHVTLITLRPEIPDVYIVPPSIQRIYASLPPDGWQRWVWCEKVR